jgi:hypothetical protein
MFMDTKISVFSYNFEVLQYFNPGIRTLSDFASRKFVYSIPSDSDLISEREIVIHWMREIGKILQNKISRNISFCIS